MFFTNSIPTPHLEKKQKPRIISSAIPSKVRYALKKRKSYLDSNPLLNTMNDMINQNPPEYYELIKLKKE